MQIVSRFDGRVLLEVPGDTLRGANFRGANLTDANLAGADLARANLAGADLARANLTDANLAGAYLAGANLTDAYLAGADLTDANLTRADLTDANFEGEKLTLAPLQLIGLRWPVLITGQYLRIGCQRHAHETWAAFSDAEIDAMQTGAAKWWAEHKSFILAACEFHRAAVERASAEKETK